MKQLLILLTLFVFTFNSYAQVSTGKVSSLVAAENYFAAFVKEKGQREGFLKVSNQQTIVFRPDPVKVSQFYDKKQDDPGQLIWEPSYAKISRSGDWGFTTGPFIYTDKQSSATSYGQFLSVWNADKKGIWKLVLDIGSPHGKPSTEPVLDFRDPKSSKFFRQISAVRLKQREDMITTTDRLFASTALKNMALGYNTFLGPNARMIFPGYEPVIGRDNITKFLSKEGLQILTEPLEANRSIGSDLAYTYGTAQVTKNNKTVKYNYVRIWESQEGFEWNVIVELFSPAG